MPFHLRRYWPLLVLLVVLLLVARAHAVTYEDWIAGYPSLTGEAAGMLADPDGDGAKNLIEFALSGGDPTLAQAAIDDMEVFAQDQAADGTWGEPIFGRLLTTLAEGSKRSLGIRWQPRPGTEGIRYVPQADNRTLTNWLWGASAITRWDSGGYTYARFNSEEAVWRNQFMRLTVEVAD